MVRRIRYKYEEIHIKSLYYRLRTTPISNRDKALPRISIINYEINPPNENFN